MTPFRYHIELAPEQIRIFHAALVQLLRSAEPAGQLGPLITEILAKLPEERAIRAILLDPELSAELAHFGEAYEPSTTGTANPGWPRLSAVPDEPTGAEPNRPSNPRAADEPTESDPSDEPDDDPPPEDEGPGGPSAA